MRWVSGERSEGPSPRDRRPVSDKKACREGSEPERRRQGVLVCLPVSSQQIPAEATDSNSGDKQSLKLIRSPTC